MPQLFLLAAALFGSVAAEEIDHQPTILDKIQEEAKFSKAKEVALLTEELGEVVEEKESEIAELLNDVKVEVETSSSIRQEVEDTTGNLLKNQEIAIDEPKDVKPVLQDLEELLEKPNVTAADTPKADPYDMLEMSVKDKQNITAILTTMAENGIFKLLFERKRLEKLGQEIRHVHPLRFLGAVFTDPRLAGCMRRIRTSSFKWDGFIDGFTERFKEEIRNNNVNAYLPGLAEAVGVDVRDLQICVNNEDLEGLVIFLLEKGQHRR